MQIHYFKTVSIVVVYNLKQNDFAYSQRTFINNSKISMYRKKIKLSYVLYFNFQKTTLAVLDHFKDRYHNIYLVGPLEIDDAKKIPTDENYNVKDMTAYQLIARRNNLEVNLFKQHKTNLWDENLQFETT